MTDPIGILLSRLDHVKETGADQWQARCPAHPDRNPSLAIARGDDGRVLLKCWSGCGAAEIVQAVGLTLADLFVRDERRYQAPGRKRQYPNYHNVLKLLRHELAVLHIAANDLKFGAPLSQADFQAVERAYQNISDILGAANV